MSRPTVDSMMEGPVPTRTLRDGAAIPVLGLGTFLIGEEAVSWGLEAGYRLIDTAAHYNNEDEVGKAIKESGIPREEIYIVTKVWNTEHGKGRTIRSFEESLKNLGVSYVDLYLMHSAIGGKTLETWDTMIELQRKGLIRSIGVANFNTHHLTELKNERPDNLPVVNQIEIHPFLAWDQCTAFCKKENIAIMAYSPLAKAEKLKNPTLCKVARQYGKTPAQIMIKWSLQKDFICIPKSSKRSRIKENFELFDFRMATRDIEMLDKLDEHYITDWPGAMTSNWIP